MCITNKDLRQLLKKFPSETPIKIHWRPTIEGSAVSPLTYDDLRVEVEGEVIGRSNFLYRLGGGKYYWNGERKIYMADADEIIIG